MSLQCCKNRVPKCHFTQKDIPPTAIKAPERLARNCFNVKFDQPKHSGIEPFLITNKVVVKSFPVGTTEDMEDFNRPNIRKEEYHYQCQYKRAEGIKFTLALQIESNARKTNLAISGF